MILVYGILGVLAIIGIISLCKPSKTVSTEQAFDDLKRSAIVHDSRSSYCRQLSCKAKNGGRMHPQCCMSCASGGNTRIVSRN